MQEFIVEGLIPLLATLMSFVGVIIVVIVISRAKQRRLEIQAEIQSKLIDKFGTTGELASFLQSDVGRQFVTGVQNAGYRHVTERAHSAVRNGILFSALGLGFLALWPLTNTRELAWPGVLLLVLGLSFFGSAWSMLRFTQMREAGGGSALTRVTTTPEV